jgi:hypothetical protein
MSARRYLGGNLTRIQRPSVGGQLNRPRKSVYARRILKQQTRRLRVNDDERGSPPGALRTPIPALVESLVEPMQQLVDLVGRRFEELGREILETFQPLIEAVEKDQPERRETLAYLADRSWYPSLDMPVLARPLHELVRLRRTASVDQYMASFAEAHLDGLVQQTISAFPNRAQFIRDARWAHNRRRYRLSVPVLLAQADGICKDALGVGLYKRNRQGRLETDDFIADLPTGELTSLVLTELVPLQHGSALHRSTDGSEPQSREILSRHGVLHGLDLTYGTRLNSLRAFMTVAYVSELPHLLDRVGHVDGSDTRTPSRTIATDAEGH